MTEERLLKYLRGLMIKVHEEATSKELDEFDTEEVQKLWGKSELLVEITNFVLDGGLSELH